jgi:transcriptional regulator with XRE-family HTH domain
MDMRQLVGRNVLRIRLEKDLTQEQLAERSGLSQQYLSDLERGKRNPTIVTLFELAQALAVSHIDLVVPDREFTSASQRPDSSPTRKSKVSGVRKLR